MVAVVLGGIGFPVVREVLARHHPSRWSVHTRLTLLTTLVLLVVGLVVFVVLEWEHEPTSGDGSVFDRLWLPLFMSVTARTAGFNTIDYGQATEASLFVTNLLMIVGGGSGGTAGGIKVGTLAVLVVAVVAEARGDTDTDVMGRRLPPQVLRQALAVLALTLAVVVVASTVLLRDRRRHHGAGRLRGGVGHGHRRAVDRHHGRPAGAGQVAARSSACSSGGSVPWRWSAPSPCGRAASSTGCRRPARSSAEPPDGRTGLGAPGSAVEDRAPVPDQVHLVADPQGPGLDDVGDDPELGAVEPADGLEHARLRREVGGRRRRP